MKTTLKVFSWISVVLGALAVISAFGAAEDPQATFLGGSLFLTQGILALVYINQTS